MSLKNVLPGVCAGPSPNISQSSSFPKAADIFGALSIDLISEAKTNFPLV